ncbi:SpoIIE family protein phosphatase [Variovorax sp. J22R24]|uniref:ATP-binding protein n=1 Tax=Variovorax gracilis TaxID=3053502 RepID=UPI002576681F|nr:ATP-binding protein [Variovorax sp. J22R24]MDM0110115.1 SpoIIE family protein phosphatase [Variovorax sp. J22R24]
MEVVRGWTHRQFPLTETSGVGEVRRYAARLATEMEWSELEVGRLAIVVTELGSNLHKHAHNGRLLVGASAERAQVEIVAIDDGPGIANVASSMRDGYSTGGTPGTGLGAARRLADDFDLHSASPGGTVCVARLRKPGATPQLGNFRIGAICLPAPGEDVCGDAWAAALDASGVTLLVADGLGHGPGAAEASQAAIDLFAESPTLPLPAQVEQLHRGLRKTRGAALCCARLDTEAASVRFSGAGNISGRIISGTHDRSFVTANGTAGLQIRNPSVNTVERPAHALMVLHSDGIVTRWDSTALLPLLGRDPTLIAALLLRDHSRLRDDATVVVIQPRD